MFSYDARVRTRTCEPSPDGDMSPSALPLAYLAILYQIHMFAGFEPANFVLQTMYFPIGVCGSEPKWFVMGSNHRLRSLTRLASMQRRNPAFPTNHLWSLSVSNRSPQPCKGCALPDELRPQLIYQTRVNLSMAITTYYYTLLDLCLQLFPSPRPSHHCDCYILLLRIYVVEI